MTLQICPIERDLSLREEYENRLEHDKPRVIHEDFETRGEALYALFEELYEGSTQVLDKNKIFEALKFLLEENKEENLRQWKTMDYHLNKDDLQVVHLSQVDKEVEEELNYMHKRIDECLSERTQKLR